MSIIQVYKAQPTTSDVHTNRPLTNISVAYIQDQGEYIAERFFPRIPVEKRSDTYITYTKNDWFRDEAVKRAPSTPSAGSGYGLGSDNYNCDIWAFHKDLDDATVANADDILDLDMEATEFVTQRLLMKRDVEFISNFLKTGVWDNDKNGSGSANFVQWSDYDSSNPIEDVTGWRRTVKLATGFKPNKLGIGGEVWDKLKDHPDVIERIKYTREAINVNPELIARAFDIDDIVVCEAIKATNVEGATAAYAAMVGKVGLLYYVPKKAGKMTPSAGYIFSWKGYGGKNAYGVTISKFYMQEIKSNRIEGEMAFDMKTIASDLGVYAYNIVT